MSPTPASPLPEMLMALGLGTLGSRFQDATRAVPVPSGLYDFATRSSAPQYAVVRAEPPLSRVERVRALRGKFRGRAPSVDEYLQSKRLDPD